ncbi:MAG: DUF4249 domain-containing protein [Chitinophagaceae bacterium]
MQNKLVAAIVVMTALLYGCEKAVDIELHAATDVLVVDASIENDQAPFVYLSTSFNYFSQLSPDLLSKSFVHNAVVSLSDGTRTVKLKEYQFISGTNAVYVYSLDTSNLSQIMLGKFATAYSLSITVNGIAYTAKTTIPALAKKVDSLWYKQAPNNPDTLKRVVYARITDPPGLGNYIRYFTSVNDSAFLPGYNSVFDDDVIDGTTYDAIVNKGVDRNAKTSDAEAGYFKKGDTVQTKLCNIDRAHFDFWRTLEFSKQSVGNPFSQPGVVLGNISGGALGYFGGYAAQYSKIIIKK